jgi:hypothetical protein
LFGNTRNEPLPPQRDLVSVTISGTTIRIMSKDHDCAWIPITDAFGRHRACTMGNQVVLNESNGCAYEVEVTIEDRWLAANLLFITWNFEQSRFEICGTIARVV